MKRVLYSICLVLILASCSKKEDEIKPIEESVNAEKFTVKYSFINQGDPNIKAVVLYTGTYFPKEDQTSLFSQVYTGITANDTVVKAIEGAYAYKGYSGCTTHMKVSVRFEKPRFSEFPDWEFQQTGKQLAYDRLFYIPLDTIKTSQDAIVTFQWPADTIRFKEINY